LKSYKPFTIALLFCALPLLSPGWAQSIAFTFDDGPNMSIQGGMNPTERNNAIIRQLNSANVKATLFLTLQDCNEERMQLVRQWGIEGHSIGNHTVNHPDFHNHKVGLTYYQEEVLSCDSAISKLPGYVKQFRFPYLKEGNSIAKRDCFRAFLKSINYRPAPVSIDASDWYYNFRLLEHLEEEPDADLVPYKEAYLSHLYERACYYDSLSQVVVNRSVKHILLLHHNQINAFFLKDVIKMFRDKGWNIVTPAVAFDDAVYGLEPKWLPAGESRILELAREQRLSPLRRPGEDVDHEKPILDKLAH